MARAAFGRNAQPLCDRERVSHRVLVKLLSPRRPGDRKDSRKVREILGDGLRCDLRDGLIGERNDVGARNGLTLLVRDIVAFDCT